MKWKHAFRATCLLHALLVIWLYRSEPTALPTQPNPKPIKVQTVRLKPPPPPKRVAKQAPMAKKTTPQKKRKKKPEKPKRDERFEKARKQLAQINQSTVDLKLPDTPKLSTPKPRAPQASAPYTQDLIRVLKRELKLPEQGEIRVALTLARTGSVLGVKILEAKSKKNETFVQARLARLKFAPFGNRFKGAEKHTFELTLTSD